MAFRSEDAPGVYSYYEEREALLLQQRDDEQRLRRWSEPFIRQGYRFEELTQIRSNAETGCRLLALGLAKTTNVSPVILWTRRAWRFFFPYGAGNLVVGGGWRFWR